MSFSTEIDSVVIKNVIRYSICTLVTDLQEYKEMVESFKSAGFHSDFCEFIYVDNSHGNKYDAYQAYNKFLSLSQGQYVILCHQDILLQFDQENKLWDKLQELSKKDPKWAVAGNAGGAGIRNRIVNIVEGDKKFSYEGTLPVLVGSLDENFLVINKKHPIAFSADLRGFHMHGTDVCIIANILGYNCYIIDFVLLHKSSGNANESFKEGRKSLMKKYERAFAGGFRQTTITYFYLSGNKILNFLFNTQFIRFFLRLANRPKGKKWNLWKKSKVLFVHPSQLFAKRVKTNL
jgi:hypothetical protein